MKLYLLTGLLLCDCVCYAHVKGGPNNTYTVDEYGAFDLPTETKQDKIRFIQEIEARQDIPFKGKGVIALY